MKFKPESGRRDLVHYGWLVWGLLVLSVTTWVWAIIAQG